jgi:peptidase A4-like protein
MTKLRTLFILAVALVACGAPDVGSFLRQPVPAIATQTTSQDAVKRIIEKANQAQATAFNGGDASAMRDTATDSFYSELVQTNRDLASSGATKIELVSTDFVTVTIDGASATAVTNETWRTTYSDGSTEEQTARNEYTLVLSGNAWRIDSDDQTSATRQPAPQPNPDTGIPTAAATSSTSSNWSGYAASGGNFTSVTATWTVPNVAATSSGADATWVGIGGLESRDLIQAGTQAMVGGGDVTYQAWIEMLPASSKPVALSVTAGDSVTVSITQTGASDWSIAMKNNTTGDRYSTTVKYVSSNSSAEWVQEAPSVGRGGLVPLDNFGTLTFTGASAVRDGSKMDLRALGAHAITMINGARQALASPSEITSDGASFSVTRTQAPSDGGTGRRRRG